MRWLFLILVFVVGLGACGILFDFLFCDSSGWKEWQEERVLKKSPKILMKNRIILES